MAIYRDFDFSFLKNDLKDVDFADDVNAIRQSICDIIMTRRGERCFNPLYGSNIPRLLFEKINIVTSLQIKDEIERVLQNWEPRIKILGIQIQPFEDENRYEVNINYLILNLDKRDSLELSLETMR